MTTPSRLTRLLRAPALFRAHYLVARFMGMGRREALETAFAFTRFALRGHR